MDNHRFSTKLRGWLPLLPVLLLLYSSYWLSLQVAPIEAIERVERHDIDFSVEQLSSTTLNAEGKPKYQLSAEKMWHFPDDQTTHLLKPVLASFFPDRPPSRTTAEKGVFTKASEDIMLSGGVMVVRSRGPNLGEQRFTTEQLYVAPERDWANTDQLVQMVDGKNSFSAVGMELDSQARTVRFLSQVKAIHVQNRN